MIRRVSVFGSTGSIGVNTLSLIGDTKESIDIVALSGGRNIELLASQAREFGAEIAVTAYEECYEGLKSALSGTGIEVAAGQTALEAAADRQVDWAMSAIVGFAGLAPGLRILDQGATLALANKESLVCAGPILMSRAAQSGARILPVDSEHSAIFQTLLGEDIDTVTSVVVTASGGALRDWPLEKLREATPEDALNHPNWDMGARITIDSASMFNKALELIETKEFFGISSKQISALIHPQSLVHAMVGHVDGAIIAHLGPHDMRHAIGFALNWPRRTDLNLMPLDLNRLSELSFHVPDEQRYPALRLARHVMNEGGLYGTAFNAAKEIALDLFLDRKIRFTNMAALVEEVLEILPQNCQMGGEITLDRVIEIDHLTRNKAHQVAKAGFREFES